MGSKFKWKGHKVYGIDSTIVVLPNSKEIKLKYHTHSNFHDCYYPQGKISLCINLFTGAIPALTMNDYRVHDIPALDNMFEKLEKGSIIILDRAYGSRSLFYECASKGLNFIVRVKAGGKQGLKEFANFLNSKDVDKIIRIKKTKVGLIPVQEIRLIKVKIGKTSKDTIVLATNLFDRQIYSQEEIIDLFVKRWMIETHFNRAKHIMRVDFFHAQDENGILQEVYAHSLLSMMCYDLMSIASLNVKEGYKISFKMTFNLFREVLQSILMKTLSIREIINRIRMITQALEDNVFKDRPKRSYPRYSKRPRNTWTDGSVRTKQKKKYGVA